MEISDQRRLIPAQVYDMLPPFLNDILKDHEGRERDIILLSTIVVLSSSLPNLYGNYGYEKIYPHLYLMVMAPAASGKGVMNIPRKLIQKIHDKIKDDSKIDRKDCITESKKDKTKNVEDCPSIAIKIVPANISSSEFYSYLEKSRHGLLMIESEADTLSKMLKNDWSNYSDVLRKAWHHESLSLSRKTDNEFIEINEPKLAAAISGTPDQLAALVKNQSNGLFSRFMMYNFEEIAPFKNVFDTNLQNQNTAFDIGAEVLFNKYENFASLDTPIKFQLTGTQQTKFLTEVESIREDVIKLHSQSFVPNVHRAGIIWFRIAMILTAIRLDSIDSSYNLIEPTEEDFNSSFEIMKTILRHSQYTFNTLGESGLSIQDQELLDNLNIKFSTQNALDAGSKLGIGERTVYDKIKQLQNKRIIKRIAKANFRKL